MAMTTTGVHHRDAKKCRDHEYQENALNQIRDLRRNIEKIDQKAMAIALDNIFKDLDYKLS